jgi:hypothetical protein
MTDRHQALLARPDFQLDTAAANGEYGMYTNDLTTITELKGLLEGVQFRLGMDGMLYAWLMRDDRPVTYPVYSPEFMTWFRGEAASHFCSIPSPKAMEQAIKETEYSVRSKNLPYPVAFRVHAEESAALVDLGNGKALVIEASGTTKEIDSGIIFPTRANNQMLPDPESAGVLEILPELLDLSVDQCRLAVIWLMSLFQQDGRYPILIIIGPRQSGKTRLARNIRRLIDPHTLPLLPLPKGRDELKEAVLDNAILAFDKVGKIPDGVADDLLALAEGTALSLPGRVGTALHKRPTILVCEELPDAPALMENAIILRLKERPAIKVKDKSSLDRLFDKHHAKAFGSLVRLCSQAFGHLKAVELQTVLKNADLEKWILAVDKGLGLEGELMIAFANNLEEALSSIIHERPAVRAFQALVKAQGSVTATATQLLDQIEPFLEGPKDARYPSSGKALAKLLRDHKRFMTAIEIEFDVRTGKDRDRNIVATWQSTQVQSDIVAAATSPAKAAAKNASAKVAAKPMKGVAKAQTQPAFL